LWRAIAEFSPRDRGFQYRPRCGAGCREAQPAFGAQRRRLEFGQFRRSRGAERLGFLSVIACGALKRMENSDAARRAGDRGFRRLLRSDSGPLAELRSALEFGHFRRRP
jgi:hypothetical protein